MSFSPLIRQLIDSLRTLPGVGQKTAQRMAFHLVERNRAGAARLAERIGQALERVRAAIVDAAVTVDEEEEHDDFDELLDDEEDDYEEEGDADDDDDAVDDYDVLIN